LEPESLIWDYSIALQTQFVRQNWLAASFRKRNSQPKVVDSDAPEKAPSKHLSQITKCQYIGALWIGHMEFQSRHDLERYKTEPSSTTHKEEEFSQGDFFPPLRSLHRHVF